MSRKPLIAVVSFPGNNCEVESIRSLKEAGMDAVYFRWNDDRAKLADVDGYLIPGGFSYEDRGRSGMVAGRDPMLEFIGKEADAGKTVIGNCNGAQILVESGLIPLGSHLSMSLAHNVVEAGGHTIAPGFLSEWVWMTPACKRDRCATSDWEGPMHVPIAHGEGRFTTKDKDLLEELKKNDQIAFRYCTQDGTPSEDVGVTPNGSVFAIAGICNPAGNVIALMPHPERTDAGLPYFVSMRKWIEAGRGKASPARKSSAAALDNLPMHSTDLTELFIDSLITNNEERTVEGALRRVSGTVRLKQWKYLAIPEQNVTAALQDLTIFNANKERAILRRNGALTRWNSATKREEAFDGNVAAETFAGTLILRREEPDTGAAAFGEGAQTGVCYGIAGVSPDDLQSRKLREILGNPHASTLEILP